MSQSKYNRLEKHPRTKKWEQTGIALLTESDASVLNDSKKHTGIKYELAEDEFDVKAAKKDDLIAYALKKEIDLGENTKVDDIRKAIQEAEKPQE